MDEGNEWCIYYRVNNGMSLSVPLWALWSITRCHKHTQWSAMFALGEVVDMGFTFDIKRDLFPSHFDRKSFCPISLMLWRLQLTWPACHLHTTADQTCCRPERGARLYKAVVSGLLCFLFVSLDAEWCGDVLCQLSLTRTDTHIWVLGLALLFRTKGDRVYISLWPQLAVLFCLCSGSCGLVVRHWRDNHLLYFLGHDISEHPRWCRVYSRPTLLWEGLVVVFISNKATVCMLLLLYDSWVW